MDKLFETDASFPLKKSIREKVQFLFLRSFLLLLTKFLFWEEDWARDYNEVLRFS